MNMLQNPPTQTLGKVLGAFLLTTVIVGTGLLVFRVIGPIPFSISQTTTMKQTTFDVTGQSELNVVPDEAQVSVGIENTASSVASAQQKVNATINDITDALKDLGVDKKDIRTQNYNVNPSYDYSSSASKITGYRVDTNLRVTIHDFEKVNDVIDKATSLGANQVNGIQFTMSKEKEKEVTKQAREEAIKDARNKANELAGMAGLRLGRVLNVYESPTYQPMPYYMADRMNAQVAKSSVESTQIQPGSQEFNFSVTLSYETL
jgi:uncharacterized protein YggE